MSIKTSLNYQIAEQVEKSFLKSIFIVPVFEKLFLYLFCREGKHVDLEEEFKPSLLNTTVYIMSMALQISTFAVNYRVKSIKNSFIITTRIFHSRKHVE